jgi:Z1 domain.
MAGSNCAMIENIISVTINTKYKEVPPNEAEFLQEANMIRTSMSSSYPVTDNEFKEILVRLKTNLVIKMDIGIYINDRNRVHKSWLPARRSELDFFFWNRYKKYLEQEKHWNTRVTASLDKVSDEIVDLLGDPKSDEGFQRRGLVLGDVQSGKTANYTAISNKAADTGYKIIIILAGMMENLRKQTQERLDAEFSGRKSEYYLDPTAVQEIKNIPVGVGRYGTQKRIASFTSVTKDFDIGVLRSNDLALQSVNDPVLLVVKKNKRILNNLINWLRSNNINSVTGKIMLPMLLIDDEADNASVNTRNEDENATAINACIRQLLNSFSQASYLGITATPFANIFINPETEDEMLGDDLFPRDFIYSLSAPTNYIGADRIFGDDSSFSSVLEPLRAEEMNLFFPYSHKKNMVVDELPPSLYEAISYFLLSNPIRDMRSDNTQHRSMMVHVSRFTDVQNNIAEVINEWLVQVRSDLKNYSQLPAAEAEKIKNIKYLKEVWEKHNLSAVCGASWELLLKKYLYTAVAPIDVRAVNQSTGTTSLDYYNHKDDGLRVIAVGGNSLSRGLTLEGLCVSYFYRRSQMYDTLLQMGRWFGYRPNYEDMFKIWIAEEAIDWYGYITAAANELKIEIAKMKAANQTPRDFGLKVRQDPNSLIATARNKMRSATLVSRPITVSGRLLETPRLKAEKEILDANERVFKEFIDNLSSIGVLDNTIDPYYWHGIPKDTVSQLLLNFESHPWHLAFQGRALSEYIDEKMDNEKWDVALISSGKGSPYPGGLQYGSKILDIRSTESRKVLAKDNQILISGTKVRVGAGGCTKVGLSKEYIKIAKTRFYEEYGNSSSKSLPDSAYLIKERSPLLMLHIIEVDFKKSLNYNGPQYLFALGVGFPDNGDGNLTANYVVNLVEWRNWYDVDEDEDE